MRQLMKLPLPGNNVVARPSAGEDLAHRHSRSLILLALFAGALVAVLALKAGAPLVSSLLTGSRSGQSSAASSRTVAPNPAASERQAPQAAAAPQARLAAKAAAPSQEQGPVQAEQRADALTRNLLAERGEMNARAAPATGGTQHVEGIASELRQALDGEREQVAALTRELAAARREIEGRGALMSQISEIHQAGATTALYLQQVLEEERKRVATLTQELAAARRDLELRTAKASAAAEAIATPLQEALERERQRADVLAEKLAAARQEVETKTAAASPPETRASQVEPQAPPAHAANNPSAIESPVPAKAEAGVEARKLLARAELFLRQGDISAARVVLERAVAVGSAEAGYRLAETYDSRVLTSWGTLGTRGDPAKARELYTRAYADGIEQAKDRMNALQ